MKVAVLGTGGVGHALASKLVSLGHEVMMGSRQAGNEKAVEWASSAGSGASEGSFADAAAFGELVINATAGVATLEALSSAGADNLSGKLLIDVSNPLDFSAGMPPTLSVCNDDSLGEQIQRTFPDARVVKTLNTVTADVMVDPALVPPVHNLFLSGNDDAAKEQTSSLLRELGWPQEAIVDLGDISTARGTEMFLALWIRLRLMLGTNHFNVGIHGAAG